MGKIKFGAGDPNAIKSATLNPEPEVKVVEKIVEVPVEKIVEKIVEVEKKTEPKNSPPPDRVHNLDDFKVQFEKFKVNHSQKVESLKSEVLRIKSKKYSSKDEFLSLESQMNNKVQVTQDLYHILEERLDERLDQLINEVDALTNVQTRLEEDFKSTAKDIREQIKRSQKYNIYTMISLTTIALLAAILF
jgi:hypothetical protein